MDELAGFRGPNGLKSLRKLEEGEPTPTRPRATIPTALQAGCRISLRAGRLSTSSFICCLLGLMDELPWRICAAKCVPKAQIFDALQALWACREMRMSGSTSLGERTACSDCLDGKQSRRFTLAAGGIMLALALAVVMLRFHRLGEIPAGACCR